jgi:hypothetical protein
MQDPGVFGARPEHDPEKWQPAFRMLKQKVEERLI